MNTWVMNALNPLIQVFKPVSPLAWLPIVTMIVSAAYVAKDYLIAAEMLAQNPGLGKFVWDEFQNGSSHSLARIMLAVITIGTIGFPEDHGKGAGAMVKSGLLPRSRKGGRK